MRTDQELLGAYVRGEEGAFVELVGRYAGMVMGAARRQVGREQDAEDVTQVVFAILARKAGKLMRHPSLAGWLHTVTQYTTANLLKMRARREKREREVGESRAAAGVDEMQMEEVEKVVDGAIGRLSRKDREVVLLRYFRGMSMEEVGAAVGTSGDTARKRIERAVERLREDLTGRGVMMSAGGMGVLMGKVGAASVPAGMAGKLAAGVKGLSATQVLLAKGTGAMMMWTQVKVCAALCAAVAATVGGVIVAERAIADAPPRDMVAAAPVHVGGPAGDDGAAAKPGEVVEAASEFPEVKEGRIIEHVFVDVKAGRDAGKPREVTIYEKSGVSFDWARLAGISGQMFEYRVVVAELGDDVGKDLDAEGFAKAVAAAKAGGKESVIKAGMKWEESTCAYPERDGMKAGNYAVWVEGVDPGVKEEAANRVVRTGCTLVRVKPAMTTQVMINDFQADGTVKFESVQQGVYGGNRPMVSGGFMNSDFVHVTEMLDEEGKEVKFTETHEGNVIRYSYKLNRAVQPGEVTRLVTRGTETGMVRQRGATSMYTMAHSPAGNVVVRRLEIHRLPEGARVLGVMPENAKHRVAMGREEICMDEEIEVGGTMQVMIRWEMK